MQFQINQKIGARFKLIVRKSKDDEISRESEWFDNIVLDSGLNQMSVGTWIDRCCVGTGNSVPVFTQTALDNFLASTIAMISSSSAPQTSIAPYYLATKVTWRFAEGAATGNLSEIGLGWNDENLWNRALIRDAEGNPTTITILADEFLDVISEIRYYPQQSFSGSFNLLDKNGMLLSEHDYWGIPLWSGGFIPSFEKSTMPMLQVYSGDIGGNVVTPPGNSIAYTGPNTVAYPTATSCAADYIIGLADGIGEHRSFTITIGDFGNSASWQSQFYQLQIDPPITKDNTQEITYSFAMSWSRYGEGD